MLLLIIHDDLLDNDASNDCIAFQVMLTQDTWCSTTDDQNENHLNQKLNSYRNSNGHSINNLNSIGSAEKENNKYS